MSNLIFKPIPSRYESFTIPRGRWAIGSITRTVPGMYMRPRTAVPWVDAGITPAELRQIADFIEQIDEDAYEH